jgi:hypothetical protein
MSYGIFNAQSIPCPHARNALLRQRQEEGIRDIVFGPAPWLDPTIGVLHVKPGDEIRAYIAGIRHGCDRSDCSYERYLNGDDHIAAVIAAGMVDGVGMSANELKWHAARLEFENCAWLAKETAPSTPIFDEFLKKRAKQRAEQRKRCRR